MRKLVNFNLWRSQLHFSILFSSPIGAYSSEVYQKLENNIYNAYITTFEFCPYLYSSSYILSALVFTCLKCYVGVGNLAG